MEKETSPKETCRLRVTCNEKETIGNCRIDHYTRKEALFKGIKMWLIVMLVSALSIVIPLVHFVSVPVGLALSPLVGLYYFFTRRGAPKRVIGDFLCPECQSKNHVETVRIDKHYFGECAHCHREFEMVPQPSGART